MKTTVKIASVVSLMLSTLMPINLANAQEPLLGEIQYFGGNFAPRGWAFCEGQLLAISQHEALFSLLGTNYGGDGRTTFGLPDLRGRVPIHEGSGLGLSHRSLGQKLGSTSVNLQESNLPQHTHELKVSSDNATSSVPTDKSLASNEIYKDSPTTVSLHGNTLGSDGSGIAMNNMQPNATARCIIALQGIYPSRN